MSKPSLLKRKWLLAGTILTSLSLGLPAMAQDTPPATTAVEEATAPADDTTEVVITGSRIRKSEFNSASPVQIITAEKSSLSGMVSATEILQSSSVAAGSGQINNTFTGYVVDGGDGINTVSLRGLGSQRTLVMLNGRRMPPAGVSGTVAAVDLNTLPSSLVSRYEILKDGASSIYGSDAVAGVVNVITRKNVEGFEVSATTKFSEQGGGDTHQVSLLWGKSFDKGHILIAGEATEQTALRVGDREAFRCPMDNYVLNGSSVGDFIDPNTGTYKCYGGVTNGYTGTYYTKEAWPLLAEFGISNYFGSRAVTPAATCAADPTFTGCIPGWAFIPYASRDLNNERLESGTIISPVKTQTVYLQGDYRPEWSLGAELYGELLINHRESEQNGWRTFFPRYSEWSPVNPWSNASDPYFGYPLQAEPYIAVPSDASQDVTVYRLLGGMRGEMGRWSWDTYLSHSSSNGTYDSIAIPNDRVEAGTGTDQLTYDLLADGVCGPSAPAGCIPLDVFNTGILEDGIWPSAMYNYYFVPEQGKTTYDQTIFEATMTGDLMELPAGPLGAAFGIQIRHDKIHDTPGEFSRNANVWGFTTAGITKGSDTVKEVFGELEIPVLKGKPFFEDLTLNTSGRYSDYKTVGPAWTYKVGLDWAVDNRFRIRGTAGTSFRAPGLFELFLADQTSFLAQTQVDPCIGYGFEEDGVPAQPNPIIRANCAADGLPDTWIGAGDSAQIITGGGPDLNPETSYATTFGFVITPPETGFKLAIDFWKIKVIDQIASTIGGVYQCYASEYFRSRPGFCDTFTRDTDGSIATIDASYRNIPTQTTAGIDFTIDYTREFNFGTLNIASQITHTKYDKYQTFPGDTADDYNGIVSEPRWVGDVQTQFRHKDWTFTWTVNYAEASSNYGFFGEDGQTVGLTPLTPSAANVYTYRVSTPDFFTHDFTVRYQAKSWEVLAGVVNLTDNTPPYLGRSFSGGGATRLGNYPLGSQYYDGYIGRQFYLRLSKDF